MKVPSIARSTANRSAGTPVRLVGAPVLIAIVLAGLAPQPAHADVSALKGSAYGAFVKVGLFGGEPNQVGAAPAVTLPADGASQTKSLPSLIAQFGPATIFGGQYQDPGRNPSGELKVSTEGKLGRDGYVTSAASVVNIGPGPLIADKMTSTCTAKEGSLAASTTVTKGIVETSYDVESQEPVTSQAIPDRPTPNTAVEGTIDHVGDRFRIVFNEQIVDGSTITVRAAHMYLLGNIAVGDMIIGESVCGITAVAGAPAPPATQPVVTTTTPVTVPETTTVPTTAAPTTAVPTTVTQQAEGLDAKPIRSDSDAGGSAVLIGALVAACAMAGLLAFRGRRRRPT